MPYTAFGKQYNISTCSMITCIPKNTHNLSLRHGWPRSGTYPPLNGWVSENTLKTIWSKHLGCPSFFAAHLVSPRWLKHVLFFMFHFLIYKCKCHFNLILAACHCFWETWCGFSTDQMILRSYLEICRYSNDFRNPRAGFANAYFEDFWGTISNLESGKQKGHQLSLRSFSCVAMAGSNTPWTGAESIVLSGRMSMAEGWVRPWHQNLYFNQG